MVFQDLTPKLKVLWETEQEITVHDINLIVQLCLNRRQRETVSRCMSSFSYSIGTG